MVETNQKVEALQKELKIAKARKNWDHDQVNAFTGIKDIIFSKLGSNKFSFNNNIQLYMNIKGQELTSAH